MSVNGPITDMDAANVSPCARIIGYRKNALIDLGGQLGDPARCLKPIADASHVSIVAPGHVTQCRKERHGFASRTMLKL